MELPKMTGFLWFYLTILLAFGQVWAAPAPTEGGEWELGDEPAIAEDSLQIKLDRDLYKKQGSIVYTSHLQFDETPDISDNQLYKIAKDAFNEMRGSAIKNGLTEKMPNIMTTLLIGKELIFASSAKGRDDPYDKDSQVQGDLNVCSQANEDRQASQEWRKDSGAKVVAISKQKNAAGKPEPLILAPCGKGIEWGCNVFVNGVYVLDSARVDADPRKQAFRYKNMLKEKKLKTAPARPALPPPNRLPPPIKPNTNPGGGTSNQGDKGSGKPNRKPPGGKPKRP